MTAKGDRAEKPRVAPEGPSRARAADALPGPGACRSAGLRVVAQRARETLELPRAAAMERPAASRRRAALRPPMAPIRAGLVATAATALCARSGAEFVSNAGPPPTVLRALSASRTTANPVLLAIIRSIAKTRTSCASRRKAGPECARNVVTRTTALKMRSVAAEPAKDRATRIRTARPMAFSATASSELASNAWALANALQRSIAQTAPARLSSARRARGAAVGICSFAATKKARAIRSSRSATGPARLTKGRRAVRGVDRDRATARDPNDRLQAERARPGSARPRRFSMEVLSVAQSSSPVFSATHCPSPAR